MKLTQQEIMAVFHRGRGKNLTAREVMAALRLPREGKRTLHRMLRDLERQGLLGRIRGGRYALSPAAKQHEGIVTLGRRGDGFIDSEKGGRVRIPPRYLGGAFDGDRVRYVLLRRDRMNRLNGRVTEIVERAGKPLVGQFQRGRSEQFVLPVDDSFSQPIRVGAEIPPGLKPGDWVVVRPATGPAKGALQGEIVEVLGDPADPAVELMAVAARHDIPLRFPAKVVAAAGSLDPAIGPAELAGRKDLRHLPFVTIDGETARDFDDAVTLREENNRFRLFVAIADVGHYVPQGSVIDRAACERGTSAYFPGFCIPMLPEALSNDLCSLRPGVDRLVMVAELLFDRDGERRSSSFYPAVINSRARLTYNQVQDDLDRHPDRYPSGETAEHLEQLPAMLELSKILTAMRTRRGSLELDLPEPEIVLDASGRPQAIGFAARLATHRIIEEFMLAANEAVATYLAGSGRELPYRIHEPPDPGDFGALNSYLAARSGRKVVFDHDLHFDLQELIRSIEPESEKRIVSRLLLRSLKQARYSAENIGHYGLAAELYCHFTSPIRRYPDLMVHRILKQCLAGVRRTESGESLAALAEHCSRRERIAVDAEREVQSLLACRFMEDKVGNSYEGTVGSVLKFGIFVELRDFPVEGLVHLSSMGDDYYHFDEASGRLIGERTGRIYAIGNSVKISVESVNIARREIDFAIVPDRQEGSARGRSRSRHGRKWK